MQNLIFQKNLSINMILTGHEIEKELVNGNIIINPFNKNQINPNSYDFRLGDIIKIYKSDILDP